MKIEKDYKILMLEGHPAWINGDKIVPIESGMLFHPDTTLEDIQRNYLIDTYGCTLEDVTVSYNKEVKTEKKYGDTFTRRTMTRWIPNNPVLWSQILNHIDNIRILERSA